MQDVVTIQAYINNVRRHLARYLRPQVGVSSTGYPAQGRGAIVEFRIGPNIPNEDKYLPAQPTVNDALREVKQHAFGGDLKGFTFEGTNIIGEGDRLILIKGGDTTTEWSDEGAAEDVRRIVAGVGAPPPPQ